MKLLKFYQKLIHGTFFYVLLVTAICMLKINCIVFLWKSLLREFFGPRIFLICNFSNFLNEVTR